METHRYKQVYIPTNEMWEKEMTERSHPSQYNRYMTRHQFVELINNWNAMSFLQSTIDSGRSRQVNWLYIAL